MQIRVKFGDEDNLNYWQLLFIIVYNSTESEYRYIEPYYTLFVYPIITYKYHIDSRKIHNVQEEETF